MWSYILLLHLWSVIGVYSQPDPGAGGLYGTPIEAQCLAFFRRERIWVPIELENVAGPSSGSGSSQVSLARHHIIPVRSLREFFDTAVARNNGTNNTIISGIMNLMGYLSDDALTQYAGSGALRDFITSDLNEMRDLQTLYVMDNNTENNPPLNVLFSSDYLVRSMYQWIPANIFIGPAPNLRSDDPGDGFEVNARYITGEENFQRLVTIRNLMTSYVQTGHTNEFNECIELLSEISRERHTPYPYDSNQWEYWYLYGYNIKHSSSGRRKRAVEDDSIVHDDPYCLVPLERIKLSIENFHLIIVAKAIERARKHNGFYTSDYPSWKEWYVASTWQFGIYIGGFSMTGEGLFYNAYGYKFNDNSFAVGILGTDTKGGTDNWVNLRHDFTTSENHNDYAGQVYFDKNGRPVAIVITSRRWAEVGSGWSFIYNAGKWEYESTDSWDERRFAGRTESLDPKAPRFKMT